MARINRNNKAYDSADVDVFVNGLPVNTAELTYGTNQEHQKNYTLKPRASSWSKGKIDDTATWTLMLADQALLENSAKGDLLALKPFTITVTFSNEVGQIITDVLTVKFQSTGREVSGDMGLNYQHELFALDIQYNV